MEGVFMKKFKLLVFIGRFQPFHNGHLEVVKTALTLADRVLILVGSSFQPRTEKNPFTYDQRFDMIANSIANQDRNRVAICSLHDHKYNDQKWAAEVQSLVHEQDNVGIIGHSKDDSTYYLKMFPQWQLVEHKLNDNINATDIRSLIYENRSLRYLDGVLPPYVISAIDKYRTSDVEFLNTRDQYQMIKSYKKSWESAPYPPVFVTVDGLVIQSGHILMVVRGAQPGKGQLALPGGFIEQNEWLIDGVIRELREETRLKVPVPVLKGCIKQQQVFDRPDRSSRGRTITHVFHIELPPGPLPPVKGSDDAAKALWIPISNIKEELCFEDHWHIINAMLGL